MSKTETPKTPAVACNIAASLITFTGDNGEVVTLDAATLTEELRHTAMMHGLKQKLGDAAALSRNPDTGRSATTADKMAAVREIAERLTDAIAPSWNKPRAPGAPSGGLLLAALCALRPNKTPDECKAYLQSLSDDAREAMRKVPEVAEKIEEIKAARAKPETAAMVDAAAAALAAF